MAKRFSIINYILVSILVAVGIFLSVCSFKIPFYVNDFASFAGAIPLGYDVGQGQTAVFEVKPTSTEITTFNEQQMQNTLKFVEEVLTNFNGTLYQVGLENDNMIRVEIAKTNTSEDLMFALSERLEIVIRGEETDKETDLDISADRIKKCYATYQATSSTSNSYSFGVAIEFDDLGKKQFETLTREVKDNGSTIYFYSTDGEKIGSLGEVTKTNSYGVTFMPVSSLTTEHATNMYAVNVMMGAIDAKLNIKENSVSSAFVGYNSLTYVVITFAISFVLIAIIMIVRYRDLGLLAMFTGLINIILYLFFLQALPIVTLTLSGIIGCVIGFCLTMVCQVIYFENIKKEYKMGRKIPLSFKLGYKNSILNIVDVSVISIIASVILYFIGFEILKSFAIALFLGGIFAIFSSLVIMRGFTKWYLPLNSTNAKHLNLKKEATNEEK